MRPSPPEPYRRPRYLPAIIIIALVIVAAIAFAWRAHGQAPKIHGIGYSDSLQPGATACLYPSWPAYFAKSGSVCRPMDLTAQPFRPGQPQDFQAMRRRYGGAAPGEVTPDGQGTWLVGCDAESIQQGCARWLEERCRNSPAAAEYDCSLDWNGPEGWRAARDSYDYWATHPAGLPNAGGSVSRTPGQPDIIGLSSPGRGQAWVKWRTRLDHSSFAVAVGPALREVPGDVFSTVVELPAGIGGDLPVTVTAFYGPTPGKPSIVRFVHVEPRAGPVPSPTPTVAPTPAATPTPTQQPSPTPTPGECAKKVAEWPEWLALVAKLGRCRP